MEQNMGMDIIVSIMCVLVTGLLFLFYFLKKINSLELILISYVTQTFNISFISGTINPFFFVSWYFMLVEISGIIKGTVKINIPLLCIILLPVFSSVIAFTFSVLHIPVFGVQEPSLFNIVFNIFFFYFKYFLPLIFLGTTLYKFGLEHDSTVFFGVFKKIALYSCYLALFQFVLSKINMNEYVLRIAGLRKEYVGFSGSGDASVNARVSAFFMEPKALAFFLSAAFPMFLVKKEKFNLALILVVGVMTASQTFYIGIFIALLVYTVFKKIDSIRAVILTTLLTIFLFFSLVYSSRELLYNFYINNSNNPVVSLIMARAMDRYDLDDANNDNLVLGMPLQRDMELPVFNFFMDHPYLYLTGYGLKNGGYVPSTYFPLGIAKTRIPGTLAYSFNMRWYYFICEFGIVIFMIWFLFFTKSMDAASITDFEKKYYSFLWCFLFFFDLEPILILVYGFYRGKKTLILKNKV